MILNGQLLNFALQIVDSSLDGTGLLTGAHQLHQKVFIGDLGSKALAGPCRGLRTRETSEIGQ